MALFKIWLTFSEQLHFWQQSGTARPQSRAKIQHLHPPKQKANPVILCCHVSPMENPISQVIKLVGLKNGVGSLGTKPFDISFRNKIYLSKKGVPVLTMTFYWNPKENYPAKSEGDYQWGYHLPPSPVGTNTIVSVLWNRAPCLGCGIPGPGLPCAGGRSLCKCSSMLPLSL